MAPPEQSWAVVVPVKRLATAKTRLDVAAPTRVELALAMALDTVSACLRARTVRVVVVVTDEERAARTLAAHGAVVVGDEPDAGLNPALVHGARAAAGAAPGVAVAALSSDLPALSSAALDDVLTRAEGCDSACVADAAGTGTTLLTAAQVADFRPEFGPDSWHRHLAAGAVDLTPGADARVRRDVDTVSDLVEALRLGCGPATTAAVRHADLSALR